MDPGLAVAAGATIMVVVLAYISGAPWKNNNGG